ncbi:hypothetical protein [Streptomyces sp. NPDC059850]|uniref:hypothetical protein n=1 Tax=Streptomyces sp. NPDC059850 TaxID=3346970 RepID=UPI00364E7693
MNADAPPTDWRDPLFRGLPETDARELMEYAFTIYGYNQRNGTDTWRSQTDLRVRLRLQGLA